MGGMTSNRKRNEECMNVANHTFTTISPPSDSHRKRPKLSSESTRPLFASNGVVSRISRYPEAKRPLLREVHAPCRPRKFDLSRAKPRQHNYDENENDVVDIHMGNSLARNYEKAKDSALAKCRFVSWKGKEKEVIDVDAESSECDVMEDDSGVEEVAVVAANGGIRRRSTSSPDSALTNNNQGNLKVAAASGGDAKAWGSVEARERDLSSVHAYKKLLQSVSRRTDAIHRLEFEIELNERRRETLNLLRPKKEPVELVEEVVPHEPFVPLTEEEEDEVARAFSANRRKILVTHVSSNIEITGDRLQCLRPGAWLNDEVINLYLELLKERERREPQRFLKCHFFSTFFYKKLTSPKYDYKAVKRWTSRRKLGYDLFECDKIFVPIHQEIHWCLGIINKKDKKFQYLDSLKGKDYQVLNSLAKYFVQEVKEKTEKDIDVSTWEREFVEDLPEQENGFDCGVFMIKYADFYSRGLGLCFNQEHMPYFRLRTAKEILRLKAD